MSKVSAVIRVTWAFLAISLSQCEMVVDLGHELDSNSVYWPLPGLKPFELSIVTEGYNFGGGGIWLSSKKFCGPEHTSTHIDAPYHFSRDGWKIHDIPLEHFIAQAVVIDVREKVKQNPDYAISAEDIEDWIESYGQIPNNSVVLMNTGWSSRYGDKTAYFGHPSDASKFSFPGIGLDASTKLLDLRNSDNIEVVGVGIDTASLDVAKTQKFPTHITLSAANIYLIENLKNLDKLPPRGIELLVMPMKIRDGTGAPSRIIARIGSGAATVTLNIFLTISCLLFLLKIAP